MRSERIQEAFHQIKGWELSRWMGQGGILFGFEAQRVEFFSFFYTFILIFIREG